MNFLKKRGLKLKKYKIFLIFLLGFFLIFGLVQNYPAPVIRPNKNETNRIIFVPGIKTWDFYLWGWKRDLPKKFPNAEIIFLDNLFYLHFQHEKIQKIVEQGTQILSDGKPTKIIAHSFGGILSRSMIDKSSNANITKFISMASPHKMTIFGVGGAKNFLKMPSTFPSNLKLKTFGGYLDPIVPTFWTSVDNENHKNIFSEHLGFLLFKKIRAKILEEI